MLFIEVSCKNNNGRGMVCGGRPVGWSENGGGVTAMEVRTLYGVL